MARREDIDTGMWSDPDFMDLGPVAKSVYVWTFTNHRCGMAGIYKVGRRAIELETGWDGPVLDDGLAELEAARFAFYDGRVMFVRSRVKHLRTKSPSIATAIFRDLESVGEHPFRELWYAENADQQWVSGVVDTPPSDPHDTPSGPPRHPLGGSQGKGKGKGGVGGPGEGDAVAAVWETYTTTRHRVLGPRSTPQFTKDRRALIARRLKEWPAADLIDAVQGWQHFPHNRGENERGTPFCDIELVLRDAAHIERFRDRHRELVQPAESMAELADRMTEAHQRAAA